MLEPAAIGRHAVEPPPQLRLRRLVRPLLVSRQVNILQHVTLRRVGNPERRYHPREPWAPLLPATLEGALGTIHARTPLSGVWYDARIQAQASGVGVHRLPSNAQLTRGVAAGANFFPSRCEGGRKK